MFGNKEDKKERLEQLASLIKQHNGITQAELARLLGVNRSTIGKDLAILENEIGVYPWEDNEGRLYL